MLAVITGMPGWVEIFIFGMIILLLFGSRLPGAMRALGTSVVEFKKGTKEAEADSDGGDEKQETDA